MFSLSCSCEFFHEVGAKLLVYIETEGVFDTTVLFSSEGAKDHRALSVDFTFLFHYC
jgi:hypothetical protein